MSRGAQAEHEIFDRALLVRRRARYAPQAEAHDFLLRHVTDDLAHRLELIQRRFALGVSLGSYHGVVTRRLRQLPNIDCLVDVEASPGLLAQASGLRVCADEELLPFKAVSLDLVVSGLALHLVNDLPGVLIQVRRALKADGLLLASLLGPRTLFELREAFAIAESEVEGGASPRIAPFPDVRALGSLLQRADFALPVTDSDILAVTYATPLHLMSELRHMAAGNMLVERSRRPLRRRTLARAIEIYCARHGRPDGRVPATFEIVTMTGWAPHASQQRPLRPGSAQVRLADALRPAGPEGENGRDAPPAKD